MDILWEMAYPGIDIDPRDRRCHSPLHLAAFNPNCDVDLVKKMLDMGADVNAENAFMQTPLFYMIQYKRCPDIVKLFLDNGAYVNAIDRNSESPLFYALKGSQCNIEIVRLLLEGGAFANQPNNNRVSPLHLAARLCDLNVIELLLEHEAHANAIDNYGQSTLHWALSAIDPSVLDPRVIKVLINNDAYVQQRNWIGQQPLHLAAYRGNVGIVELLLNNGAGENALDNYFQSPLILALSSAECDEELIKLLLVKGADVHIVCNSESVLHLAARKCKPNIIKLLLNYGAFVNAVNNLKLSPLHIALMHNNLKAVELLLKSGSCLIEQNCFGQQPLHTAVIFSSPEAVKQLLDHGASPNVLDKMNRSPLMSSLFNIDKGSITTVMKLLFDAGAKVFLGTSPVVKAYSMLRNEIIAPFPQMNGMVICHIIRLLISYSLVEQPRVYYRVNLPIHFISPHIQYSMSIFVQECSLELASQCPDSDFSIREFIMQQRQNEDRNIDAILKVLFKRPYPYYKEVIGSLLTKQQLKQKLEAQFQSIGMTPIKHQVPLVYLALYVVTRYISAHEDLLNLSLAFYDISHPSK